MKFHSLFATFIRLGPISPGPIGRFGVAGFRRSIRGAPSRPRILATALVLAVGVPPMSASTFEERRDEVIGTTASYYDPGSTRYAENRVQLGFHALYLVAALEENRRGAIGFICA